MHFQAPPSAIVTAKMQQFVNWFNNFDDHNLDRFSLALLKSAITHLYFECIHPFEDGNGRIGRALAEYALSHSLNSPVLLSISKVIEKNKQAYYKALKLAQSSLDITEWLKYFSNIILKAQIESKQLIEFTVKKVKFYDRFLIKLNERQLKVVQRMFEAGIERFAGGMTTKKYISITKTSKATATRDLQHLNEMGAFSQSGGGRSIHYNFIL